MHSDTVGRNVEEEREVNLAQILNCRALSHAEYCIVRTAVMANMAQSYFGMQARGKLL